VGTFKLIQTLKKRYQSEQGHSRVVIVGAGQVGMHIMQRLSAEGFDVVLIDENEEMVNKSREMADVAGIVGNGCNPEIYSEIDLNHSDLFLALTDSDETNLVACHIAQAFGCTTKIARVRQPFYKLEENTPFNHEFWQKMGVEVLFNQDSLTIREIDHLIENPGTLDTIFFAREHVQIAAYKVKPNSLLLGRRLIGLRDVPMFENLLVVAVNTSQEKKEPNNLTERLKNKVLLKDNLKSTMLIPRGDYKIREGDLLYLAGQGKDFSGIGHLFDPDLVKEFKRIFILGGSILSHQLAEYLIGKYSKTETFLLENSKKTAYTASESLNPRVHVLLTGSHDIDSLLQEGLDEKSIFIGASPDEDDNVLACLLAKEKSRARTITVVQSNTYSHLVKYLEVDAVISPKSLLVEDVLKSLRKNVYDVISAKEQDAELLEFVVLENCFMVNQKLKDFRFPENAIIAFIFRGEDVIIPRGEVIIQSNDHLIIYALKSAIEEVQNLFKVD